MPTESINRVNTLMSSVEIRNAVTSERKGEVWVKKLELQRAIVTEGRTEEAKSVSVYTPV